MTPSTPPRITTLLLALLLCACGGGSGSNDAPAPAPSPAGGSGLQAVARMTPTTADGCSAGAVQVSIGLDANGNGTLDDAEVSSSAYLCNGGPGSTGPTGPAGPAGQGGLLRTDAEPAGVNCPAGGTCVRSGVDADADGVLDDAEVAATAYVCNGSSAAFEWQAAQDVHSEAAASGGAQVVAGADGTVLVTWLQEEGAEYRLWARRYHPGTGWGLPAQLDAGLVNARTPSDVHAVLDAQGRALVAWSQADDPSGSAYRIYARRYTPTAGWEPRTVIDTGQNQPRLMGLAGNSAGQAMALFRELQVINGAPSLLWAVPFDPSLGWGAVSPIGGSEMSLFGSIVMDGTGRAQAVWMTDSRIMAAQAPWGGGWSAPQPVSDDSPKVWVQMAGNAAGDAVAVWRYAGAGVAASIHPAGTSWGPQTILEPNAGPQRFNQPLPAVAMDPFGNAVVAWTRNFSSGQPLLASRYDRSLGWQSAVQVGTVSLARGIHVAMDGVGRTFVAWIGPGTVTSQSIWVNRHVPGTSWNEAGAVLDDGTSHSGPGIAFDASGTATLVATSASQQPSRVRMVRYR